MNTAIVMYLVVEDRFNEQANALAAIKAALDITECDETLRAPNCEPGSYFIGYMNHSTAIHFAASLDEALRRIEVLKQTGVRFGILTDLMFTRTLDPEKSTGKEKPYGLEVVANCIGSGTPVVVCSDTDHHDVDFLRGTMSILGSAHPKGQIPMILDKKDWAKAFSLLRELMV